ncbi:hypothetical protein AVEN_199235-1 [Araneus ventricosus]|uniref:Uncharacterized protein n=1 Tax=Araneus ventricosus TaxID=182803 RepID=A0A4Y2WIW8_ARAVE|nr:hypothetical protein AVEN_199235-1 [Araneus ventricosus]
MTAELTRAKKEDLEVLAEELGVEVPEGISRVPLQKLLLEHDPEFVNARIRFIVDERIEMEKEQSRREFELEKLRITTSQSSGSVKTKIELRHLINKFEERDNDISLYLQLFERQAKWAQIDKKDWVCHLLALLPYDITQLIAREPTDKAEDYEHVKSLLLKKFKLSPEKFRQKFVKHQRRIESNWTDFAYELENYFREWITGLGVHTFEQLIGLMVTDQIKRRVPADIQDHFIDEWSNIVSANELCKKLDAYEEVRGKSVLRKKDQYGKRTEAGLRTKPTSEMKAEYGDKWRSQGLSQGIHRRMDRAEDVLERRRKPQCYECGSFQHLRPQCPKLKKKTEPLARVNHVGGAKEDEFLLPFTSTGLVNGIKMPILRDTGASIDIICRKYITPEMLTGEHVWVQQPLDVAPICLPLAEIELSCDKGHIITKAAVVREELDQGRYLLGNRTACLFGDKSNMVCHLNAVQTRRQRQLKEQSKTPEPEAQLEISHDEKSDEDFLLESRASFPPPAIVEDAALSLIKVDSVTFGSSQRSCPDLQPLFAKAREAPSNSKENCVLEKDLLFKKSCDKVGQERLLLVVPAEFRENIKTMIHEGTSAHLGITKTKYREIKSEKDFYLRATIEDLMEFAEEMELQVDSKLTRNVFQELILKEDKVYAFERIPMIIDDRQEMERGKREWEESMEKLKFEREIGSKQLSLVITAESDVRKIRVQLQEQLSKQQNKVYEVKQLQTDQQTANEETDSKDPDHVQFPSENMPRVSLEHEDRVPDFLQSQIEADDSVAMNLDSIHSISTSSSGREIAQETVVDTVELSSERDKLSSVRALEVNKPASCKVGNGGASSNVLKSGLLTRVELDSVANSKDDLVVSCELSKGGLWMFDLCRFCDFKMLRFHLVVEKHQSRGFSPTWNNMEISVDK